MLTSCMIQNPPPPSFVANHLGHHGFETILWDQKLIWYPYNYIQNSLSDMIKLIPQKASNHLWWWVRVHIIFIWRRSQNHQTRCDDSNMDSRLAYRFRIFRKSHSFPFLSHFLIPQNSPKHQILSLILSGSFGVLTDFFLACPAVSLQSILLFCIVPPRKSGAAARDQGASWG